MKLVTVILDSSSQISSSVRNLETTHFPLYSRLGAKCGAVERGPSRDFREARLWIVSVGRPSGSYLVDSHPKETRAIMRRSNLHSRDRPGLYSSARWQLQFEAWFTSPSLTIPVLGSLSWKCAATIFFGSTFLSTQSINDERGSKTFGPGPPPMQCCIPGAMNSRANCSEGQSYTCC